MKLTNSLLGILSITLALLAHWEVQGAQFNVLNLPPMNLIGAASDSANNTYVLGIFTNTLTIGGKTLVSAGGSDYVLAQYLPNGTVGWAISFGTTQDEDGYYTVLKVTSNAVYISGFEQGSMHIVDTTGTVANTAYTGGGDGFLLKFSLSGVSQWQASVTGTSAGDGAAGVDSDASGNVYWAGIFNGCCPSQGSATLRGGDGTSQTLTTPSFSTGFLTKLSPGGTPLWVVRAYNRDVQFNSVAVDSSGAVVVSGHSYSGSSGTATTLIDAGGNTRSIDNPGYQSSFAAEFNSSGIYQWSVYSSGSPDSVNYLVCQSATAGTNGDVLLGGSYNTIGASITGADGVAKSLPAPNGQDGFVAALNSSGSVKWLTQIGGTGTDVVNSVSLSSSGGITAAGQMTAGLSLGSTNIASLGGADGFVAMLDQNGNIREAFALGGPASDDVISVIAGKSGYDLVAGQQGGSFSGLGVQIPSAGPFVLTTWGECIPHAATATATLDHGFVVAATITDGGCGYTNTPSVLIRGGGGTGATATAVVSDGVVVDIIITDAGSGYTSTPTIFISSPLGLQVVLIKAVKPSFLNLSPGTNYQTQISTDMRTWTNYGAAFTATNTIMVYPQYFDVDNWNSLFFRVQSVP